MGMEPWTCGTGGCIERRQNRRTITIAKMPSPNKRNKSMKKRKLQEEGGGDLPGDPC